MTQLLAGKIMADVFWNSERVIHVDFLSHGLTINAQHYINLLPIDVPKLICIRRKTWKTVRDHPTAWKCLSAYVRFDKGSAGISGLGNHDQ